MKRLILLAGVLGAMALMLPAAAQDAEEYAIEAYVTDSVNLRSGPGVQYPAVAVIPGGSPVILHGCLEGWVWCDLTWSDFRGWVSGKFVAQEYESQPITVVEYGPALEIPIIAFGLATYWDRHYHHRHFYRERDRWDRYWVANPVRPPVRLASPVLPPRRDGWRDGRGPDWRDGRGPDWRDGRGPDWRDARRPDGRGPDWRDGRGPDGRGPDGRGPDWRDGRRTPDGTGPTWRTPDGRDGRMPQAVPGTQGQPPGFMPGGQQRTPGGQPGARQATPGVPGQQPGFVPGGQQRTPGGQPGARQATPGVPGQQPGFVPGGQQRFPGGQPGARQAAPGGTFNQPNMPSHVQRPPPIQNRTGVNPGAGFGQPPGQHGTTPGAMHRPPQTPGFQGSPGGQQRPAYQGNPGGVPNRMPQGQQPVHGNPALMQQRQAQPQQQRQAQPQQQQRQVNPQQQQQQQQQQYQRQPGQRQQYPYNQR